MTLTEKATLVALKAHATQVRKSDGSPYVVHPIMVAHLLARHGFSDTVTAAAVVHDVLEDTDVSREELTAALGEEVVRIVRGVSEDTTLPWEERKERYAEVIGQSDASVKAVSIGDKIHNLESLLEAYEKQGPAMWKKFNRGKEKKLWFEELMLSTFRTTWEHPLIDQYEALVARMRTLQ